MNQDQFWKFQADIKVKKKTIFNIFRLLRVLKSRLGFLDTYIMRTNIVERIQVVSLQSLVRTECLEFKVLNRIRGTWLLDRLHLLTSSLYTFLES